MSEKPTKISLKDARTLLRPLEQAIIFYQTIGAGNADEIVWNNIAPTREGGILAFEKILEKENYKDKRRKELQRRLLYWKNNYESIREEVFYRHLR